VWRRRTGKRKEKYFFSVYGRRKKIWKNEKAKRVTGKILTCMLYGIMKHCMTAVCAVGRKEMKTKTKADVMTEKKSTIRHQSLCVCLMLSKKSWYELMWEEGKEKKRKTCLALCGMKRRRKSKRKCEQQ